MTMPLPLPRSLPKATSPLPWASSRPWSSARRAAPYLFPKIKVPPGTDLWVFGYGSLMWNPEFPYAERRQALLRGYHRRFCVYSHRYRGTPDRPGLVLGLDRGGSCRGIAFRVEPPHVNSTIDLLWDREMVSGVYAPKIIKVTTDGGRIPACAFVADARTGNIAANWDRLMSSGSSGKVLGNEDRIATILPIPSAICATLASSIRDWRSCWPRSARLEPGLVVTI